MYNAFIICYYSYCESTTNFSIFVASQSWFAYVSAAINLQPLINVPTVHQIHGISQLTNMKISQVLQSGHISGV